MLDLKKTTVMLNKFEGRDKFCKVIQHLCAILFRMTKKNTKDYDYWNDNMFFGLYKQMGVSRQYFRLMKSVFEVKKLRDLMKKEHTEDEFDRLMNVVIKVCFIMYWFYDNLTILSKSGFILQNFVKFQQKSMDFRLYGLTFSLFLHSRNFLRCHHQEIQVRQRIPYLKDEQENIQAIEDIRQIKIQKQRQTLILLKTIGDSFLSFAGTKLADNWLKRIFPKIMVNIGGLGSGLITCYFLYNDTFNDNQQLNYFHQKQLQQQKKDNQDKNNKQSQRRSNSNSNANLQQQQQYQQNVAQFPFNPNTKEAFYMND